MDREDNDPRDAAENAVLDDVLAVALPDESPDFVRPAPELIDAFLLGTASEAEKESLRFALARSRAFRNEILDLADQLGRLGDIQTLRRFDAVGVDGIPPADRRAVSPVSGKRSFPISPARVLGHPGFAYGVAALLAGVLVYRAVTPPASVAVATALASPQQAPPVPALPGAPQPTDTRLFVVELHEGTRARGVQSGEEAHIGVIEVPGSAEDLMFKLPIEPVSGDAKGVYVVEIGGRTGPALRLSRPRAELLHDRVLPVVAQADRFEDGGVYEARVWYAERGHELDHVTLFESRFRWRRAGVQRQLPDATNPAQ